MAIPNKTRAWKWLRGLTERAAEQHIENFDVANTDEDGNELPFIIFQDWETLRKVAALVPHLPQRNPEYPELDERIDHGFADEYGICDSCRGLIRTSPTHYEWRPDFFQDVKNGDILCRKCMLEEVPTVLKQHKNQARPLPRCIEPDKHGWVRVNDEHFQSGWFAGMNDNPNVVLRTLRDAGCDVLFTNQPSQFYTEWDVWVHRNQLKRARTALGKKVA